jgi:hypothetical protein
MESPLVTKTRRISSALSVFERNIDKNREVAAAAVSTAPKQPIKKKSFFSSFGRSRRPDENLSESFQNDSKSFSPTSSKKDGTSKDNVYSAMDDDDDDSSKDLDSIFNLSCIVQPMYDMSRNEQRRDIDFINRKLVCSDDNDDSVRSELSMGSLKSCRSLKSVSNRQDRELDVSDHSSSSSVSSRRHLSVTFELPGSKEFTVNDCDESVVSTSSSRLSSKLQKSPYRSTGRKKMRKFDNIELLKEGTSGPKPKRVDSKQHKSRSENPESDNDSSDFNSEHLIPFDDNQIHQFNPEAANNLQLSTIQFIQNETLKSIETTTNHCVENVKDKIPNCPTRQISMIKQNKEETSMKKPQTKINEVSIGKGNISSSDKGTSNCSSNNLATDLRSDAKSKSGQKSEAEILKCSHKTDSRRASITGRQTRRLSSEAIKTSSNNDIKKDQKSGPESTIDTSTNKLTQPVAPRRISSTGRQTRRASAEALKLSLQMTENRLSRKGNTFDTSVTGVIQQTLLKKQQKQQQCKLKDQVNFQISLRQDLKNKKDCSATAFDHTARENEKGIKVSNKHDNGKIVKNEEQFDNKGNVCESITGRRRSSGFNAVPIKSTDSRRNSISATKNSVDQPKNRSVSGKNGVKQGDVEPDGSPRLGKTTSGESAKKSIRSPDNRDSPRSRRRQSDISKDALRSTATLLEKADAKNQDIQSVTNSQSKIVMQQHQQHKLVQKIVSDAETIASESCCDDTKEIDSSVICTVKGSQSIPDEQNKSCPNEPDALRVSSKQSQLLGDSAKTITNKPIHRESTLKDYILSDVREMHKQQKRSSLVSHDSLQSSRHSHKSVESSRQSSRRNKDSGIRTPSCDSPRRIRTTPLESPAPPERTISVTSDASTVKTGSLLKAVDTTVYLKTPTKVGTHKIKKSSIPTITSAPLSHSSKSGNRKMHKIHLNMLPVDPTSNSSVYETTDGKSKKIILSTHVRPSSSSIQSPYSSHAKRVGKGHASPGREHRSKSAGFGSTMKSPAVDKSRKSLACDNARKSPGRGITSKSPGRVRSNNETDKSRHHSSEEQRNNVPMIPCLKGPELVQQGVEGENSTLPLAQEVQEAPVVPPKNFNSFQKRKDKLMITKLLLSTSLTNVFAPPTSGKSDGKVFHSSAPQLKVEDGEGEKVKGIMRDINSMKKPNLQVTFYEFLPKYKGRTVNNIKKSTVVTTRKLQLKFDSTDGETYPWINNTVVVIQCVYRGWRSRRSIRPALIEYRIQCIAKKKEQEILKIQHDKWQSMELTRKRMERKYEKCTTNMELADKLKAVLTRDNDKMNGQVELMKDYCDHLTLMNQHFEQSTMQMINSNDSMKSTLHTLEQQNTNLVHNLHKLELQRNEIIIQSQDTQMLLEMEQKSINIFDETIEGILNTMKGRCRDNILLRHIFDLRTKLLPPPTTSSSTVQVDEEVDAEKNNNEYGYDIYDVGSEISESSSEETVTSSCSSTDVPLDRG